MEEQHQKEVDFRKYCKTCKYEKRDAILKPCCYCLDHSIGLSEKPVHWEKK